MKIEPTYRMEWDEREGAYVATGEQIGYQAVGTDGKVWGYGETALEAVQNALEVQWSDPIETLDA